MASPSSSQHSRNRSGSGNRHHKLSPSSTRLVHPLDEFTHDNRASGTGTFTSDAQNSDSSAQQVRESLQNTPDLETRPHDSPLIFSFNNSPTSRSAFPNFDPQSILPEKDHAQFDPCYLPDAVSPQSMSAPSFRLDERPMGQSAAAPSSSLAHVHSVHPSRTTYYTQPGANGSRERFDEDMQMLLNSNPNTPTFHLSHSFDQGGSPSMDPNALHSDSETHGASQHGESGTQKTGYRREIEAKSRNKIRIAAQRLRNAISPGMRPGVSLRGAADVMEEAAEQIKRLSEKMLEMETQIRSLHLQLDTRVHVGGYDSARMVH